MRLPSVDETSASEETGRWTDTVAGTALSSDAWSGVILRRPVEQRSSESEVAAAPEQEVDSPALGLPTTLVRDVQAGEAILHAALAELCVGVGGNAGNLKSSTLEAGAGGRGGGGSAGIREAEQMGLRDSHRVRRRFFSAGS